MGKQREWRGVRMRRTTAAADPDQPARVVRLPASWEEAAAAALAALAPGAGEVALVPLAESWIAPAAAEAAKIGLDSGLGLRLRRMLRHRRGAPGASLWRGEAPTVPRFVLNLPAFFDPELGFDAPTYEEAVRTAVTTLAALAPEAKRIAVGFADLAGLLAGAGLEYDSEAGRDVAGAIAALTRAVADVASASWPGAHAAGPCCSLPPSPAATLLPGLAEAARAAQLRAANAPMPCHEATTAICAPDEAEALLGVETGGIAPAFSPLAADGRLTKAALGFLAARGISGEAALAATLAGCCPFAPVPTAAEAAMRERLAPFLGELPAPAEIFAFPPRRGREELPARHRGYAQKATIGGHKLTLRTGEYADGRLGEILIALSSREGAAFRGLVEAFAAAVSLGLQWGMPLGAYVDTFAFLRFGPAGAVEGDTAVSSATSISDYVFRHLAANYLGRTDLVPPEETEAGESGAERSPLLPLDLPPRPARRHRLRLVSG